MIEYNVDEMDTRGKWGNTHYVTTLAGATALADSLAEKCGKARVRVCGPTGFVTVYRVTNAERTWACPLHARMSKMTTPAIVAD